MDKPTVQEIIEDLEGLPEDRLDRVKEFVQSMKSQLPQGQPTIPSPGLDTRGLFIVWRCTNCGHLFMPDQELPDRCPDCKASKQEFVLVEED